MFLNRKQHKDIALRRWKRNSTRPSISQSKFLNRKQQKNCKQRRSKRNRTESIISKAKFHNRRQKHRYGTEKKTKRKTTPKFIGDKVPKEVPRGILETNKIEPRYSENVMRNFSLQPAPSGNPTSSIFRNANSILYDMDNYGKNINISRNFSAR